MLNHYRILSVVLLMALSPVYAQSPASEDEANTPDYSHVSTYYYKGHSRVNVVVPLDEFHVEGSKNKSINILSLGSGGTVSQDSTRSALVRLNTPSQSLSGLSKRTLAHSTPDQRVQCVAYPEGRTERIKDNRQVITHRIALKTLPGISIESLQQKYGFGAFETVPYDPDTYVIEMDGDDLLLALDTANTLYESDEVEFAEPVINNNYSVRLSPNDPLFSTNQWHLRNINYGTPFVNGHDANITAIWDEVTGDGVNVLIMDEGIDVEHEDLEDNVRADLDYDYYDYYDDDNDDNSPLPASWHGTASSGIAVAVGKNNHGVIGAGFGASLVGIRLLGNDETPDATVALALAHLVDEVLPTNQSHINSNSWGPFDNPSTKGQLPSSIELALIDGTSNGRGGKGVLYVWAGGNGRQSNDRASYDPYTSSRYTITVAASGGDGLYSYYSEPGPCVLVNAPSKFRVIGEGTFFTTSTSPNDSYTSTFGGTSSAAPLVAGVLALVLEKNSSLSWRDVQQILVETSTETDLTAPGWIVNGAGHLYNEDYGFGRINALAAVNAASTWTNLPAALDPVSSGESSLSVSIPDNNVTGIERVTNLVTPTSFSVEHVELTVNIAHMSRGNLNISLTSPSGTTSTFTQQHNDSVDDYSNWTFGSVAQWGENPNGVWTLHVSDTSSSQVGTLLDWSVTVHGTTPTTTIPISSNVYLDKTFDGYEQGTVSQPFNNLSEALPYVAAGGVLHLYSDTYMRPAGFLFTQPMSLDQATAGTSTIE